MDPQAITQRELEELRIKRAEIYDRLSDINAKADREKRDLRPDEQSKYSKAETEFDELTATITEAEARGGKPQLQRNAMQHDENARSFSGNRSMDPENRAGEWLHAELRELTTGAAFGDAVTPPDYQKYIWDFLAANSVGLASGFKVIPTSNTDLILPHATSDATAAWTAEGTQITASDPGGEALTITPRKLAGRVVTSNEVLNDSNPSAYDWTARSLLRSVALKLDLGFFEGSGTSPEIRGLKNVSGIQTVSAGTNGGQVTTDMLADGIGLLDSENATAQAIVVNPRTFNALRKLKDTNGRYMLNEVPTTGTPQTFMGIPIYKSSQLSITETKGSASNASSAYIYEADQIIAVRREDARVERDSSRLFDKDQSEIRCILRFGLGVPNPKAVVRIDGIIP